MVLIDLDIGNSEANQKLKKYMQENFGIDIDVLPISYWITKKDIS